MFENLNEDNIYHIYENKKVAKDYNTPVGEKDFFEICVEGAKRISENPEAKEQLRRVVMGSDD